MLTIAIPTFNRAHLLKLRLEELIPQVRNNKHVQLFVFDDGSTDATQDVIGLYSDYISFSYSAPHNMGLGRNMLHAFESIRSGWLWTLGDDDPLRPDAVRTALALIDQSGEEFAINCNSEGGLNHANELVSTLGAFLESREVTDVLFMSSNLYRMEPLAPLLKVFAQSLGSIAPHLALLLRGFEASQGGISFRRESLTVDHQRQQRWSSLELAQGISMMSLLIRSESTRRLIARSAWRSTRWMLLYGLREVTDRQSFGHWKRVAEIVDYTCLLEGGASWRALSERYSSDLLLKSLKLELMKHMPFEVVRNFARAMRSARGGEAVRQDSR